MNLWREYPEYEGPSSSILFRLARILHAIDCTTRFFERHQLPLGNLSVRPREVYFKTLDIQHDESCSESMMRSTPDLPSRRHYQYISLDTRRSFLLSPHLPSVPADSITSSPLAQNRSDPHKNSKSKSKNSDSINLHREYSDLENRISVQLDPIDIEYTSFGKEVIDLPEEVPYSHPMFAEIEDEEEFNTVDLLYNKLIEIENNFSYSSTHMLLPLKSSRAQALPVPQKSSFMLAMMNDEDEEVPVKRDDRVRIALTKMQHGISKQPANKPLTPTYRSANTIQMQSSHQSNPASAMQGDEEELPSPLRNRYTQIQDGVSRSVAPTDENSAPPLQIIEQRPSTTESNMRSSETNEEYCYEGEHVKPREKFSTTSSILSHSTKYSIVSKQSILSSYDEGRNSRATDPKNTRTSWRFSEVLNEEEEESDYTAAREQERHQIEVEEEEKKEQCVEKKMDGTKSADNVDMVISEEDSSEGRSRSSKQSSILWHAESPVASTKETDEYSVQKKKKKDIVVVNHNPLMTEMDIGDKKKITQRRELAAAAAKARAKGTACKTCSIF